MHHLQCIKLTSFIVRVIKLFFHCKWCIMYNTWCSRLWDDFIKICLLFNNPLNPLLFGFLFKIVWSPLPFVASFNNHAPPFPHEGGWVGGGDELTGKRDLYFNLESLFFIIYYIKIETTPFYLKTSMSYFGIYMVENVWPNTPMTTLWMHDTIT